MTIKTKSAFLYGYNVTANNFYINFSEGGPEFTATVTPGTYSFTNLGTAIAVALNAVGGQEYTVTTDRDNRHYIISAPSAFSILGASGSNAGVDILGLIGFPETDLTGSSSYRSTSSTGTLYKPQFKLQRFTGFEDWQEAAESKVNQSASGLVEVYSIGTRSFMEFEIKYANSGISHKAIEFDAQGIENLRDFMRFAITKGDMEFIPDRDDINSFETVLLERSPTSGRGTSYKLRPMRGDVGEDFYETGVLRFRKKV